jgi:hypothetical protein
VIVEILWWREENEENRKSPGRHLRNPFCTGGEKPGNVDVKTTRCVYGNAPGTDHPLLN